MPEFRSLLHRRFRSVRQAWNTFPDAGSWWKCTLVYGIFLVIAAPIGMLLNFIRYEPAGDSWALVITLALILSVSPCLLEELFFRAVLLPHPREGLSHAGTVGQAVVSLLAYIIWHPLNAYDVSLGNLQDANE